ncbi:MAG: hypothetical protein AABZ74_14235 [Cyanobacteriota bacterium]
MGYRCCPRCGSTESGAKIWICKDCPFEGHSSGVFNGSGCWSGSGGCPRCGSNNYTCVGYID